MRRLVVASRRGARKRLETDASDFAVGGVTPIRYYSKKRRAPASGDPSTRGVLVLVVLVVYSIYYIEYTTASSKLLGS